MRTRAAFRTVILLPKPFESEENAWGYHRLGPPALEHADWDVVNVLSLDLTVLSEPDEIIRKAREFAARHPEQVETFRCYASRGLVGRVGYSFDSNSILVPKTTELDAAARNMIAHPEACHPFRPPCKGIPADDAARWERYALDEVKSIGVQALANFKSDQNIAVLKSVLKDESVMMTRNPSAGLTKVFWIRKEAYDALTAWGVDLPAVSLTAPS